MALNITKKPLNIIVFIYDINDLRLRESRRDTINAVTAFGGGCCCLGTQSCKTIIQKYFDDRLSSGFSEQLIDAVNEIGPLVSQVIPSHSRAVAGFAGYRCRLYQWALFEIV